MGQKQSLSSKELEVAFEEAGYGGSLSREGAATLLKKLAVAKGVSVKKSDIKAFLKEVNTLEDVKAAASAHWEQAQLSQSLHQLEAPEVEPIVGPPEKPTLADPGIMAQVFICAFGYASKKAAYRFFCTVASMYKCDIRDQFDDLVGAALVARTFDIPRGVAELIYGYIEFSKYDRQADPITCVPQGNYYGSGDDPFQVVYAPYEVASAIIAYLHGKPDLARLNMISGGPSAGLLMVVDDFLQIPQQLLGQSAQSHLPRFTVWCGAEEDYNEVRTRCNSNSLYNVRSIRENAELLIQEMEYLVYPPMPIRGRPFVADSGYVVAPAQEGTGWALRLDAECAEDERNVRRFTEMARLEHASIASFNCFSLSLMACGAPLELVQGAQKAALQESRHAELAFSLATHFNAGVPVGASRITQSYTLTICSDLGALAASCAQEGCIDETFSCVDMARDLRGERDPLIAEALREVVADEAQHAALAWRTLRWALAESPQLGSDLMGTFTHSPHAHLIEPLVAWLYDPQADPDALMRLITSMLQ